jgi:hypothetical protein
MAIHLGAVPAGSTIYIPFASYDANGASATLSGLVAGDIEVYKNGSATARASDNGYALLDTDGIDFSSKTGINGFSIDLNDNSDAGFYVAGGFYWVVVASVTIATQTVNLIAATFTITDAIDLSDVQSHLTKVYSDTTAIHSDTTIITSDLAEVDTSDIRSAITVANSQILIIKSDTSDIKSSLTIIDSNVKRIESDIDEGDFSDILSRLTVTNSQVLIVKSDTSDIKSHLTVLAANISDINSDTNVLITVTSDIQSDTNKLVSDAAEVDTSDIHSLLTLVRSDTAVIEAVTSDIQSDTNVLFTKARGLVLFNGTIGATGNDTTHVHLSDLGTYGDDELNNYFVVIYDVSEAEYHVRQITDWTTTGDLATVTTLPFTPEASVDLYWLLPEQSGSSSGGLSAAQDSKLTQVHGFTSDIQSDTNKLVSDATEVDTSDLHSLVTIVNSRVLVIKSDVSDIYSDTTIISSDTAVIETATSDIQSDTNKLVSDATEVDTSDIQSLLTKVYSDTAVTEAVTAGVIADAVWDEATSGHVTAGTFGQTLYIARANTAAAGGATTITLDGSASATDDFYNGHMIVLTGGTGLSQARFITDYVGATKVATVGEAWLTNPDSTSVFVIIPFPTSTEGDISDVLSRLTVTNSQVLIIKSDTSDIKSHLTVLAANISDINSDTNIILAAQASQFTVLEQNTSDTESALVKIYSDTTAIEGAGGSLTAAQDSKLTKVTSDAAQITFTVPGKVDANITHVNEGEVDGSGSDGDPWGPV